MATLMIIALVAGAVMLMAPPQERETRAAAEQLARRLTLAAEESIITNRPVGFVATAQGYGFARLEENGWTRIESESPLMFHVWPEGVTYTLEQERARADEEAPAVRFDALGGATPARITLRRGGVRWRVDVDGQGESHVARVE
ncbi:MAG: GspH/FimT family pseudopilin [Hyphomonadaceae bacterium]|nr:GspH/FimT family pseudopilin [Hyphomonadaceae bacterium]